MDLTKLLYYFSIADDIHVALVILSTLFGVIFLIFAVLYFNCFFTEDLGNARKYKRKSLISMTFLAVAISVVLIAPDEDDSLLMVSGTVLGEVMDTTNTIDKVPIDMARFLRTKIQKEAYYSRKESRESLKMLTAVDSLEELSKEELIEIVEAYQGL